jgi:hypothetical protein
MRIITAMPGFRSASFPAAPLTMTRVSLTASQPSGGSSSSDPGEPVTRISPVAASTAWTLPRRSPSRTHSANSRVAVLRSRVKKTFTRIPGSRSATRHR